MNLNSALKCNEKRNKIPTEGQLRYFFCSSWSKMDARFKVYSTTNVLQEESSLSLNSVLKSYEKNNKIPTEGQVGLAFYSL